MGERPVHTVEVPPGDGSDEAIRVQIHEVDEALVRAGRGGRSVVRAERSSGRMPATVRPVAESFVGRFRGLANAPDEITLESGVSLSAGADVVIAGTHRDGRQLFRNPRSMPSGLPDTVCPV